MYINNPSASSDLTFVCSEAFAKIFDFLVFTDCKHVNILYDIIAQLEKQQRKAVDETQAKIEWLKGREI